jgi:hypothetical protein
MTGQEIIFFSAFKGFEQNDAAKLSLVVYSNLGARNSKRGQVSLKEVADVNKCHEQCRWFLRPHDVTTNSARCRDSMTPRGRFWIGQARPQLSINHGTCG